MKYTVCAALLLALACSANTPTTPTALPSAAAAASPGSLHVPGTLTLSGPANVRSASGTGHLAIATPDGELWRNFSFVALGTTDGSARGQFEFQARSVPVRVHGRVTCLGIAGNRAWIGGIIEQFVNKPANLPPVPPETPAVWRVVDNGQGRGAPVDMTSGFAPLFGAQPGAELAYCRNMPDARLLAPLGAGNIQVRSRE